MEAASVSSILYINAETSRISKSPNIAPLTAKKWRDGRALAMTTIIVRVAFGRTLRAADLIVRSSCVIFGFFGAGWKCRRKA
jgi:hypothetical protein